MTTFFEELKSILETSEDSFEGYDAEYNNLQEAFFYDEGITERYNPNCMKLFDDANIKFRLMDSYGGEGQGDDFWSVYEFKRGDEVCYIKLYGWYASYEGATFQDMFEVHPKQVTVTQWG